MIVYQNLNIAGEKITLGLDENLMVRDILGNHVLFFEVKKCGVFLSERDLANTILHKIQLN